MRRWCEREGCRELLDLLTCGDGVSVRGSREGEEGVGFVEGTRLVTHTKVYVYCNTNSNGIWSIGPA